MMVNGAYVGQLKCESVVVSLNVSLRLSAEMWAEMSAEMWAYGGHLLKCGQVPQSTPL